MPNNTDGLGAGKYWVPGIINDYYSHITYIYIYSCYVYYVQSSF